MGRGKISKVADVGLRRSRYLESIETTANRPARSKLMTTSLFPPATDRRAAPLDMDPDEFRALGHALVDRIAGFLTELPERAVTPGETPAQVRAALGNGSLPEDGGDPASLLDEAFTLLSDHSLFNGHPRFWGYITSSAAPIGALGDLLAAAINPNVGGFGLGPMGTE